MTSKEIAVFIYEEVLRRGVRLKDTTLDKMYSSIEEVEENLIEKGESSIIIDAFRQAKIKLFLDGDEWKVEVVE